MTDAAPPKPQSFTPTALQSNPRAALEKALKVTLESQQGALQLAAEQVKLKGLVIAVRADGLATVRTERGDVEVRLPPEVKAPPRPGDTVELDIPPPSQSAAASELAVTLRVLERRVSENSQNTQEAATQRTTTTPVDVVIQPREATAAPVVPPPLEAGEEVRLQPLPAALYPQVRPFVPAETFDILLPAAAFETFLLNVAEDFGAKISERLEVSARTVPALPDLSAILQNPQDYPLTSPALSFQFKDQSAPLSFLPAKTKIAAAAPEALPSIKSFFLSPQNPGAPLKGPEITSPDSSAVLSSPSPALSITPDFQTVETGGKKAGPSFSETFVARADHISLPEPGFFITGADGEKVFDRPGRLNFLEGINKDLFVKADPGAIAGNTRATALKAHVAGALQNNLPVVVLGPPAFGLDFSQLMPADAYILHAPPAGNLIQGADLQLSPQGGPIAPSLLAPLPPLVTAGLMTPGAWPVLDQIEASLLQTAPQIAQAMVSTAANPANPAQAMPAALFFIAAIRGGDLQSWLGEKAVETLRQSGKGHLLQRLSQEGGLLGRLSAEPASTDWRGLAVPLHWDNQIHKAVIHYKQDGGSDEEQSGQQGKGTRFLVDLSLTRMGKVQIDGLLRGKNLDMALRTITPFSEAARVHLRRLYTSALEFEGLAGELSFQNRPEQWVTIKATSETLGLDA